MLRKLSDTFLFYANVCRLPRRYGIMSISVYTKLFNQLREQITQGGYAPGQRMPTEREICEIYGVSRITVRHALRLLCEQGLVVRHQGRGTFVRSEKPSKLPILNCDFTGSMRANAPDISRRLLVSTKLVPPADVAEILGLAPKQECLYAERLDVLNGEPMACDKAYIPLELAGSITDEMLADIGFLYIWVQKENLSLGRGVESIEAVNADSQTAALLGVPEGTALLLAMDQTTTRAGKIIARFETFYRGDRYKLISSTSY